MLADADLKRLGLAYLGFEPMAPNGGKFSVDEGVWITHSTAGSLVLPGGEVEPPKCERC